MTPSDFTAAPVQGHAPFWGYNRLEEWGVIRARGDDARHFLQGQLTQDVLGLDGKQARLAGFCSAKGRLMASFVVWLDQPADSAATGSQDVLLACSADLLPTVLKRLSMFVLRAKCKLSDASAELALFGIAAEQGLPTAWQRREHASGVVIGLPQSLVDGRVVHRALLAAPVAMGPPTDMGPAMDTKAWSWLEVHSAVARIVAGSAELFVPQMVNFELTGGVSFQKGCYPGQEVVARSQYRGTLKRRAYVLHAEGPAVVGQEVIHNEDAGQPAGAIAMAASFDGRHAALAELKIASLNQGTLHLGAASGPALQVVPQPYDFPVEQA